jgi:putative addiction module killer protein
LLEIRETERYARWFERLPDPIARRRILVRLRRLSLGNPGDASPVGGSVSELRIHHGPGYRIYFTMHTSSVVILLAGGDKRTQHRDIREAIALANNL